MPSALCPLVDTTRHCLWESFHFKKPLENFVCFMLSCFLKILFYFEFEIFLFVCLWFLGGFFVCFSFWFWFFGVFFIFRLQYWDYKCRHEFACFPFSVAYWYYSCCHYLRYPNHKQFKKTTLNGLFLESSWQ